MHDYISTNFKQNMWSDAPKRLITMMIGAPLVLLSIYLGFPIAYLAVLVVGLLVAYELAQMVLPRRWWSYGYSATIVSLCVTVFLLPVEYRLYLLLLALISLGLWLWQCRVPHSLWRDRLANAAMLTLMSLYVGVVLAMLLPIRALAHGLEWTLLIFIGVWMCDIFALVGGRLIGRHKLAPRISPKKTVEGAIIGVLVATLSSWLFAVWSGLASSDTAMLVLFVSILVPPFTVAGDLIVSWAKREFGLKDTGTLLPGHGGILDRIDGLLFAIPVAYGLILL